MGKVGQILGCDPEQVNEACGAVFTFVDLSPDRNLRCAPNGGFPLTPRADLLALPHSGKTWRRWDGRGVQGRGYPPGPRRSFEIPAARFSAGPAGTRTFQT